MEPLFPLFERGIKGVGVAGDRVKVSTSDTGRWGVTGSLDEGTDDEETGGSEALRLVINESDVTNTKNNKELDTNVTAQQIEGTSLSPKLSPNQIMGVKSPVLLLDKDGNPIRSAKGRPVTLETANGPSCNLPDHR